MTKTQKVVGFAKVIIMVWVKLSVMFSWVIIHTMAIGYMATLNIPDWGIFYILTSAISLPIYIILKSLKEIRYLIQPTSISKESGGDIGIK